MKFIILLLSFCITLALAAPAPPVPVVSETYTSKIYFEIQNNTHHLHGEGEEARDLKGNKAVIHAENDDGRGRWFIFELDRFDLGQSYEVDSFNFTDCHTKNITGSLPLHWAWLANATYSGSFNNMDFWNATFTYNGGLTVHVGAEFSVRAPNIPIVYEQIVLFNNNFERTRVTYQDFQPKVDPNYFEIPKVCGGTYSAIFF